MAVLRVTRIPVPEWVPAHARGESKFDGTFTEEDFQTVQEHRDAILALLQTTVESYLKEMAGEDCFPRQDRLTGDYYIGSETYAREEGWKPYPIYRINIEVRCLENPRPPQMPRPDDYLGLDVLIRCDPVDWQLRVDATDSSSI